MTAAQCGLILILIVDSYNLKDLVAYIELDKQKVNIHNTFCSLKCSNTGSTLFRRWANAA